MLFASAKKNKLLVKCKWFYYFCVMAVSKRRSDCPISFALDIFGDKWSLLIIRDLAFKNKKYYVEFLKAGEGIATNILADRLNTLEAVGIIEKEPDPEHGSKLIYSLTAKGKELIPALVEIIVWSAKYDKQTAADKAFVNRAKKDREGLIKEIRETLNK